VKYSVFILALCGALDAQDDFFEARVRPMLVSRCQGCHGGKAPDLSTVPGSRLLEAVGYQDRVKMPPSGPLPDAEVALLREWVRQGAKWPAARKVYTRAQREFWSFRPLAALPLPAVKNTAWVRSPLDQFILASLEANALAPAPPADRLTWIQRVTLDLTGLPPSEAEVQAFLADPSADAEARLVDRLLESPRYGEKWGRHWLDVARYADSTGADEDYRYPHAWRYRDYVIDAFNRDLPYDQFIREQVAGDLLPAPAGQTVNANGIIATGFLALGPKLVAEQDKVKMFYDIVDEQIDVVGKAVLGLTVACARCHDHKFDPISTKDYYALASIFASTKQLSKIEGTVSQLYYAPLVPKDVAAAYEAHQQKVAAKQGEIDAVISAENVRYRDEQAPRIAASMLAARRVYLEGVPKPAELDQRWVDYLRPTKERRAHLERWYQADAASIETVAHAYQSEFIAEALRRKQALEEHARQAEAATVRGEKPPPPPKFLAGDHRFYSEVALGKGPLTLPAKDPIYSEEAGRKIESLKAELAAIKAAAPPEPPFACAVGEDQPVEQRVFLRGNPEAKGDVVPKRFPTVLAGDQQPVITSGGGRLELANWLVTQPLTSRVMVNRLWQGHFGQGLVRTPNNFGLTGERPTHPLLLDWLASEFIRQGWSMKKMHRLIVLSNTYRMSSASTAVQREKDAENRLLSRFPMRRKTVEEIRDSLLLIDGRLDLTMGGSLQKGEGTDNEFSDSRKSIHPDSTNRRTVYLPVRRSNLSSLFTLYDFGDGTTSTEVRAQTNVAPQALYMMNSKFVAERSRGLAQELLKEGSAEQRIRRAWLRVLGRDPTAEDIASGLAFVAAFPGKANDELAWASYCRSLVSSNDFIYVY
jgi:hypothetical protein